MHDQQGLEHLLLGGTEVLRGFFTEGGDALNMLVFTHLEGGVRLGQQCYGGGCCAALLTFSFLSHRYHFTEVTTRRYLCADTYAPRSHMCFEKPQ